MIKPFTTTNGKLRLRPTMFVGLGGTGHQIALRLKRLITSNWPAAEIEARVKFLVFDTTQENQPVPEQGRTVSLEPGSEYFDIGQTPVANIKRNLARQAAIRERLGGIIPNLPPTVLRNGAKQLRPLGLLAFLWRFQVVETQLTEAIWTLAGRQHSQGREGINVFIANSLVGGTGSSTFLDVAYVIRDLFDELGNLADFCYITGVGVLPRAFHGINGPNLIPNAVASLKELNHCMLRGGFQVRYPTGRVITTEQPPFNIYYLVDGIDERGHTWRGPGEVCRLAAEAIFLQMGSQVGQKHENVFDNVDEVLVRQTDEGDGTFYGSFGLAALVFPGPAVARACAVRQAGRVIDDGLLAPASTALPEETLTRQVADFTDAAGLDLGRLVEHLARDDQDLPLTVEVGLPGWVNRLSTATIPGELVRYVREYEQARLGTDFKRWLIQNETRLTERAAQMLRDHLTRLSGQAGLLAAEAFLTHLAETLADGITRLNARLSERDSQQVALSQELGHLETALLQAGESSFLVRSRQVARAQHAYLTTAQHLFDTRWQAQITAAALALLSHLSRQVQEGLAAGRGTVTRLQAVRRSLRVHETPDHAEAGPAGITTQSLAGEALLASLFERHAPDVIETLATLFREGASPLDWRETAPAEIEAALLVACEPAFEPVAALTVEQAMTLQPEEASPDSFHAWLLKQATPSWNLDRTRLADGGAGLQRLDILGVPDDSDSLYGQHAASLVSTGDPSRITAFTAHIGAAHTAIQQWDSYEATYHQVRGYLPLHILPQFQAQADRANQTFALGFVFGFIENQGAYFYYLPADPLERKLKLAQGLANSLRAFAGQEGLEQDVRERVEHQVATQGVEATLRTLHRYYAVVDPDRPADDLVLELKRLVRNYADELRQIHQFGPAGAGRVQSEADDDELIWPEADLGLPVGS